MHTVIFLQKEKSSAKVYYLMFTARVTFEFFLGKMINSCIAFSIDKVC